MRDVLERLPMQPATRMPIYCRITGSPLGLTCSLVVKTGSPEGYVHPFS
jgi:hypothetical protein